jgi:hypothetical protein
MHPDWFLGGGDDVKSTGKSSTSGRKDAGGSDFQLNAENCPGSAFEPRDGWVTHNHREFYACGADDRHNFHCLFYMQHSEDAKASVLKKLIGRLHTEILVRVSKQQKAGGKRCPRESFALSDADGNAVRCLLEFSLPVKIRKLKWYKTLASMLNWMDIFSYHECGKSGGDGTPAGFDRNAWALRNFITSDPNVVVIPC